MHAHAGEWMHTHVPGTSPCSPRPCARGWMQIPAPRGACSHLLPSRTRGLRSHARPPPPPHSTRIAPRGRCTRMCAALRVRACSGPRVGRPRAAQRSAAQQSGREAERQPVQAGACSAGAGPGLPCRGVVLGGPGGAPRPCTGIGIGGGSGLQRCVPWVFKSGGEGGRLRGSAVGLRGGRALGGLHCGAAALLPPSPPPHPIINRQPTLGAERGGGRACRGGGGLQWAPRGAARWVPPPPLPTHTHTPYGEPPSHSGSPSSLPEVREPPFSPSTPQGQAPMGGGCGGGAAP